MLESCIEVTKDKKIVVSENRSKFTFDNINGDKVKKIQIDGCKSFVIQGRKCDWLLVINDIQIYVELKGTDIDHAITQLKNTILHIQKNNDFNVVQKIFCYIVTTRSPLSSQQIQNAAKSLKKSHNATLRVKNTPCLVKPTDL
jgi:hypothetical protein